MIPSNVDKPRLNNILSFQTSFVRIRWTYNRQNVSSSKETINEFSTIFSHNPKKKPTKGLEIFENSKNFQNYWKHLKYFREIW